MGQLNKKDISVLVKQGRAAKGYTQQHLSDVAGISLRSIQRIENGEVLPRMHTLKVLAQNLEFTDALNSTEMAGPITHDDQDDLILQQQLNKPRRIILSAGIGLSLLFIASAFLSQSVTFPETTFELFNFLLVGVVVYAVLLFKIWK